MPDRKNPPEISELTGLTIPYPREIRLDNGIMLYIIDSGDNEVNNLSLVWKTNENDNRSKYAAKLLTSMIREGTSGHTGIEIAELIELNGAWLRINDGIHNITASLSSLNSTTGNILPVFIDILTDAAFPEETFKVRLSKLITDERINREKVESKASDGLTRILYGKEHPFSQIDSIEKINEITTADLRQIYNETIRSTPPAAFLAGKITKDIENQVVQNLSKLKFKYKEVSRQEFVKAVPDYSNPVIVTGMENREQSSIQIAIPIVPSSHPDYLKISYAVYALGGYFGSRLESNIREDKGYTYGISAFILERPEITSARIYCECDNRFVYDVINEIKFELKRLATEPIGKSEMSDIRRSIMTALASRLDNPFAIAGNHINAYKNGWEKGMYEKIVSSVEHMSPEDIIETAGKYLTPEKMLVSIAGDISKHKKN